MLNSKKRLIETDEFDFEFLSQLAKRESWRKEIHRPVYHIHKWWAKRLGTVFRGILLGTVLDKGTNLSENFYTIHNFHGVSVFDPFMGSGTTIGEAHKLGMTAFGKDINPVAAESVRVAMGKMDSEKLFRAYDQLSLGIGEKIKNLYRSVDKNGRPYDVLYYFWVMQAICTDCSKSVDLFPSWIISRNAYPKRKPEVHILCPSCGNIFAGTYGDNFVQCQSCKVKFNPNIGTANGSNAKCSHCNNVFPIIKAVSKEGKRPEYRLYAKLILTQDGQKEYLPATKSDLDSYRKCSIIVAKELKANRLFLPKSELIHGYNTKQAMRYGFYSWKEFFNDRQLLGLGWLNQAINKISDNETRDILLLLFSGILEFNNLFASYKGEGTGAVRHMFSHHILKPERTPIEANIWGTAKSSGSFSNLFRNRIVRALAYRQKPTEVNATAKAKGIVSSLPFKGIVELKWPTQNDFSAHSIYLSCGDSASSGLPDRSIDLIITDPPFFDNVHYSELADFFYAWQQMVPRGFIKNKHSTRSRFDVQDSDPISFSKKLESIFKECYRVLRDHGLFVFTYHHSRDEGWTAVANATLNSGFIVTNTHPIKSEMSIATPKWQSAEPIQLDSIVVCKKQIFVRNYNRQIECALIAANRQMYRLKSAGFTLSKNDRKIIIYGQLLTTIKNRDDIHSLAVVVKKELTAAI